MIYVQVSKEGGRSGHLAKDQLTGLILKQLFGFEFISTPTNEFVDHTLGFKGLGVSERPQITAHTINQLSYQGLSWDQVQKFFAPYTKESQDILLNIVGGTRLHLFQVYEWEKKGLVKPNSFESIRSFLRSAYQRRSMQRAPKTQVAVHIRRGDIALYTQSKWAQFSSWNHWFYHFVNWGLQRWRGLSPDKQHYCFPIHYYQKIMNQLRRQFKQHNMSYHFTVLSESENSLDLQKHFKSVEDVTLRLNGSLEEDFQCMVDADVLITSNSSFSQLAAYYSQGLKIYSPCDQFRGLDPTEFVPVNAKGHLSNASHPLISRLESMY